jgi:alcohol dehydrogenase (cytochrome c)
MSKQTIRFGRLTAALGLFAFFTACNSLAPGPEAGTGPQPAPVGPAATTPFALEPQRPTMAEHVITGNLPSNPAANVTSERIARAPAEEPGNWLTYHGSYDSQRFSRLNQISTANVSGLSQAWQMYLPVPHGFTTTPLVVDGVMYFTTGGHTGVYAVDAATGKELWHYTAAVVEGVSACCDWVNRGVAIGDGKVFFTTLDAKLLALDARTGQLLWEQMMEDWREGYTATVAPLFVKDKVIVGISGGEYGVRGFVDAYDARTGKRAWRFWTIPGPGEPGHETWQGEHPTWMTGGGSTWVTGSYDPQLNLLYWTTGNPGPVFNGQVREGDNLYTDSVLALDPDTGKLRWHYQWTPHDIWDYDGVNEVILTDMTIDGRLVKALIHADKNGHFYVIDRTNGKFIKGQPFARQTWAKRLDPETGRPEVNPAGLFTSSFEYGCPGPAGAKEWNHMAFSPMTGMAYIPVIENCGAFRTGQAYYVKGLPFWGGIAESTALGPGESHGKMMALNPVTMEKAWEMESEWPVVSSVLATAGDLVFWGDANGTLHGTDARNGKDVWTHKAPMGMHGSPITYTVSGKQYVAFPVGWGGWINGFAPGLRARPSAHLMMVFALP